MNNEEDESGYDVQSLESFIVLENMGQPQGSVTQSVSEVNGEARPALYSQATTTNRLRVAGNSAELTAILTEIWRPDTTAPLDIAGTNEISSRQGRVLDIDVEDILFNVEEYLKKLLSLIVYKRTGFAAKTAATDVFTWLCSLDVVLDNPVFSKEDICKWIMGLCKNVDISTESSALRGIRNLVQHSEYQKLLQEHPTFVKILDYIQDGGRGVTHADVYVFEIYHTVMNNTEESAPGQDEFLQSLLRRMGDSELSTEARLWGLKCMETCIRLSENRGCLMDSLLERNHILTWLALGDEDDLKASLEMTLACLNYLPDEKMIALLISLSRENEIMKKVFGSLQCGFSHLETAVLKFVYKVAEVLPNALYDDYLDDHLVQLQIVLEQGTSENKQWVLGILHKVATADGPMAKNEPLPLPDQGMPFVKLLMKDLTDQTFDIIHFLWSHYRGVLAILSELMLANAILEKLKITEWCLKTRNMKKIHEFLIAVARDGQQPMKDFEHDLMSLLKSALTAERAEYISVCLSIGFDLLRKLDARSAEHLTWLMNEERASFLVVLMWTPQCIRELENPSDLFYILRRVLLTISDTSGTEPEVESAQNDACSLFVATIKSAEIFGVEKIMEMMALLKLQTSDTVFVHPSADIPEALVGAGLNLDGLMVLQRMIQGWNSDDDPAFLESCFAVLLRVCLKENSVEMIEDSYLLKSFVHVVTSLDTSSVKTSTTQAVLTCLAAGAGRAHALLAQLIGLAGPQAADNLWVLMIDSHGTDILSVDEGKSVMALLKTVGNMQLKVDQREQLVALSNENAALKTDNYSKNSAIEQLIADNHSKNTTIEELKLQLEASADHLQQLERNQESMSGTSSRAVVQNIPAAVAQLEANVKRLKRQLEEKEAAVATLKDREQQLLMEVRNRDHAYSDLVRDTDSRHERIAFLEEILLAQGFSLDS